MNPLNPEKLKGVAKGVAEKADKLKELAEKPVEYLKKLWGSISEMFNKLEVKKYLAPLMGPINGIMNFFASLGKKEAAETSSEDAESSATRSQLDTLKGGIGSQEREPEVTDEELDKIIRDVKPQKEYNHKYVKSHPFERGKPSEKYPEGVTLCSGTAYKNLRMMGGYEKKDFFGAKEALKRGEKIRGIPRGDAHDVMDYYMGMGFKGEKYVGTPNSVLLDLMTGSSKNLMDLVVKSSSKKWEHRAVAFRSSEDGKWYVLDPYTSGKPETPIPFLEYKGNIKIAVPLDVGARADVAQSNVESKNSNGERVIDAVGKAITSEVIGRNCWNWATLVYENAGFPMGKRSTIYNSVRKYEGKDCGEHHASQSDLDKIEPGDWLYINNKNSYDAHGNHSTIFLGWVDKSNLIARMASCHGTGKPGQIDRRADLKKNPVVFISKPT